MKAMFEFTQKELTSGAEYIDSIGDIITALGGYPSYSVVEKVQLFFGKQITKDYGLMQVSVSKERIIIDIDVPEELVADLMEIYRDLVKDMTKPIVALIETIKVLVSSYDSRFNSFAEKLSAHIKE